MKYPFLLLVVFVTCFLLVVSCTSLPKDEPMGGNLTAGMVKTSILKGQTTQAEILQIFGSPNIVTKNSSNFEVWNYSRMSFRSVSESDAGVFIFWAGSRAITSTTSKSFDLIIIFDENDVVKEYSVIVTKF